MSSANEDRTKAEMDETTTLRETSGLGPPTGAVYAQPALPVHRIRPRRGWQSLELGELWRYRGLLLALLWRDVKAGQKQTVLGILWLFLAPLFMVAVFTVIFGRLVKIPSEGVEYPLFVLSGYMLWNSFAPAVQAATVSVVNNSHFVQKVYFPRLLIPISAVLAGAVNLLIVFSCLLVLACYYGRYPGGTALWSFPLMLGVLTTALAVGLWLAPLHARYRDVGYLTAFVIQIGFYLTPVVYPVSLVPEQYRPLMALNPMSGYVEAMRWCLFGGDLPVGMLVAAVVMTSVLLWSGAYFFSRTQGRFADIL